MERTLGSNISWLRVPPISSVMDALRNRVLNAILGALPPAVVSNGAVASDGSAALDGSVVSNGDVVSNGGETPDVQISRQLIEKLGAEGAVRALISAAYGDFLDSSRYGPVTEFPETSRHEGEQKQRRGPGKRPAAGRFEGRKTFNSPYAAPPKAPRHGGKDFRGGDPRTVSRVYVGLGRRHGASARDVAGLLMRAGGVPGRLVDAIEMKDYCAFATLPEDAAKRACAFSRNTPDDPAIRPASARDS
jgi:ATP-dependent RNA helicase DeaD